MKKKRIKRILAAAIAAVMAVCMIPMTVFAAETTVVKAVGSELLYFYNGDRDNPLDYFHTYKKMAYGGEADGYFAYCLSHHDKSPDSNGATYTKGATLNDAGLIYIINHGILKPGLYGSSDRSYMTGEENKDFYITQVAISSYLNQTAIWDGGDPQCPSDPSMVGKAKRLIADARAAASRPVEVPSISATPSEQWFSPVSGTGYWETGWFDVSITGDCDQYQLAMQNRPNGLQIINASGQVVSTLTPQDTRFKLRIAESAIKSNVDLAIRLRGDFSQTTITRYETSGDLQPTLIPRKYPVIDDAQTLLTAHLNAVGNIDLIKSSEDGNVAGIEFRVTGNGINEIVRTEADGHIRLSNLLQGTYTFTEITPDKYVEPKSQTVQVNAGQTTTVTFSNVLKKFSVNGVKKDVETGTAQGDASLDGAVYGLYHDGALVEKMTTANGGQFSSGTYTCDDGWTIQEISPAPGYNLDSTVYPVGAQPGKFTIEYNTIQATVNEQVIKGQVQIHKFLDEGAPGMGDDQIKQPEAGAEFEVYLTSAGSYDAAKETERDYLTTNADGYAKTKLLPYGDYTFHQTKGQSGTELVSDFRVVISKQGQTLSYYIENPQIKSPIKIVKKDAETGKTVPLSGMGVKIMDMATHQYIVQHVPYPSDEYIDTFYTNAEGWLMMPEPLPMGYYQAVEVQAPYGYVLNSDPVDFYVNGIDSTTVEVVISDTAQKGQITVGKTGEIFSSVQQTAAGDGTSLYQPVYTNGTLSGAVYEIYADEDIITPDGTLRYARDTLVDTLTTGTKDTSDALYLGRYRIVETQAPKGYVLNTEPQYVTLSYAGQNVEIVQAGTSFHNERQKLQLDLVKALEQDETFQLGMNEEYRNIRFGLYANEAITAADGTSIPKDGLIEIVGLDADLKAVFASDLPQGSYYVQEIATDEHYILNGIKYLVTFTYQDQMIQTVHITANDGQAIPNEIKRGNITGYKVDQDGFELGGALIGLFRADETAFTEDNALSTCVSNEIGAFGFFDVPYGEYLVAEIAPPEGFLLTDRVIPVSITEEGQTVEIESIANQIITGDITGYKVDQDGFGLGGAKIGLFWAGETEFTENNAYMVATSNEIGAFWFFNVRYGDYIIKEIAPPEGFLLTDEAIPVSIREQGKVVEIQNLIENQIITGDITGYKVDQDGFGLGGAKIGLFWAGETEFTEDRAYMVTTSNEIGAFWFFDVRYGDYIIKEIESPEGFLLTDEAIPVSIREQGQVVEIGSLGNQIITGSVQVIKIDQDYPDNRLSGAEFTVYRDVDSNQELDPEIDLATGTLQEADGVYTLDGLVYGGYFLRETKAPEYFIQDDNVYYFEIVNDGETVTVETEPGVGFANAAQTGKLHIVKTAEDGNVAGIEFRVTGTDYTGHAYDQTFTTDANGEIFVEGLRPGEYTVAEINGDGEKYVLPANQTVEIKADETAELTFHNALVPETGDTRLSTAVFIAAAAACGVLLLHRRRKES